MNPRQETVTLDFFITDISISPLYSNVRVFYAIVAVLTQSMFVTTRSLQFHSVAMLTVQYYYTAVICEGSI